MNLASSLDTPLFLVKPESLLRPAFNFKDDLRFQTQGERVLVADPVYLADVYGEQGGLASEVRQRGSILNDFGGDWSGPVLWDPPFLVLPTSLHSRYRDANLWRSVCVTQLAGEVGCDSGSFVFLPLAPDLSDELKEKVRTLVRGRIGAALKLPAGIWTLHYAQDVPNPSDPTLYRSIVARWEPDEETQPRLPF